MRFWNGAARVVVTTSVVALSMTPTVMAGERVGAVTNVEGTATVARVALAAAQPLRFRDDIYLRDRITTIQATGANALSQPRTISPADAQRLKADFRSLPAVVPAAATAPAAKHAMDLAKRDAEALSSNAAGALDAAAADRADTDSSGSGKHKSSRGPSDFAGHIGPRDATRVSGSTSGPTGSGTIGLLNVSTGGASGSAGSGGSGSLVSTTSGSLVNVGISSGRSGSSESSGSSGSGTSKK
jgi:hypothetical protein